MSWDVWVYEDPGSGVEGIHDCGLNYTHNCNRMMRRALDAVGSLEMLGEDHLYALDGMPCQDTGVMLDAAMRWWADNPDIMAEMNPANGWGDSVSAYRFWRTVADMCLAHPAGTLRMDG